MGEGAKFPLPEGVASLSTLALSRCCHGTPRPVGHPSKEGNVPILCPPLSHYERAWVRERTPRPTIGHPSKEGNIPHPLPTPLPLGEGMGEGANTPSSSHPSPTMRGHG